MNRGPESPAALMGARVLVVDDEYLIAIDLAAILSDVGADVDISSDVAEAMTATDGKEFDAAVLDVRLQGETSAPIARRLADQGVGVVFYSGQPLPPDLRANHPTATLLVKPCQRKELIAAVGAQLAGITRPTAERRA